MYKYTDNMGMQHSLSSVAVVSLMRKHHKTIRGLAADMNIPQTRVRYVRLHGVKGDAFVADWLQAITGIDHHRLEAGDRRTGAEHAL